MYICSVQHTSSIPNLQPTPYVIFSASEVKASTIVDVSQPRDSGDEGGEEEFEVNVEDVTESSESGEQNYNP